MSDLRDGEQEETGTFTKEGVGISEGDHDPDKRVVGKTLELTKSFKKKRKGSLFTL